MLSVLINRRVVYWGLMYTSPWWECFFKLEFLDNGDDRHNFVVPLVSCRELSLDRSFLSTLQGPIGQNTTAF